MYIDNIKKIKLKLCDDDNCKTLTFEKKHSCDGQSSLLGTNSKIVINEPYDLNIEHKNESFNSI